MFSMVEQTFLSVPGRQECLPYQIFLFRDKLLVIQLLDDLRDIQAEIADMF